MFPERSKPIDHLTDFLRTDTIDYKIRVIADKLWELDADNPEESCYVEQLASTSLVLYRVIGDDKSEYILGSPQRYPHQQIIHAARNIWSIDNSIAISVLPVRNGEPAKADIFHVAYKNHEKDIRFAVFNAKFIARIIEREDQLLPPTEESY